MTPLGADVEPEVYWRKARLSGLIAGRTQLLAFSAAIWSVAMTWIPLLPGIRETQFWMVGKEVAMVRMNRGWASAATAASRGKPRSLPGGYNGTGITPA